MGKDESSLRSAARPTGGAVTAQDSSNATTEINLSEITALRERNRQLEAENALLRERENTLARDGIEVLNVVLEALRAIRPGKETAQFVRDSGKRIKSASADDKIFITNSRIKAAAVMIKDTPTIDLLSEPTGPDPLRYDTRNLNERRAVAIAAHVQTTGKNSIKSTEARAVLETVEHRKLDRKTVWRALRAAKGILRASADKMGGVTRLIVPGSPSQGISDATHELGGGGGMPRRRRNMAPWDG